MLGAAPAVFRAVLLGVARSLPVAALIRASTALSNLAALPEFKAPLCACAEALLQQPPPADLPPGTEAALSTLSAQDRSAFVHTLGSFPMRQHSMFAEGAPPPGTSLLNAPQQMRGLILAFAAKCRNVAVADIEAEARNGDPED